MHIVKSNFRMHMVDAEWPGQSPIHMFRALAYPCSYTSALPMLDDTCIHGMACS